MKKILSLLFITMTILTGCDTKETSDPKVVADKFIDAISRKDMPAVKNLTTIESRFILDKIEASGNKVDGVMGGSFNRDNVVTGEATISGDDAIVPVTEKKSGESMNLSLKKQMGEWKVSLDMSTILQMAQSKAREKGISLNDSLRKLIPSLNLDSLSTKIRINGRSMDSLGKELKKRGISLDSLRKRNIEINF